MLALIVEGRGEEFALPVLIERAQRAGLLSDLPDIEYISMNGKPYLLQYDSDIPLGLEKVVSRNRTMYDAFVVLLDSDRTFPPYLRTDDHDLTLEYQEMPLRAQRISEMYDVDVVVCWAKWELESWLIGGLRRGSIECDNSLGQFTIRFTIPEDTSMRPRDAKKWLLNQFSRRSEEHYIPSVVECLALHVSIEEAQRRNPTLQVFFETLTRMVSLLSGEGA